MRSGSISLCQVAVLLCFFVFSIFPLSPVSAQSDTSALPAGCRLATAADKTAAGGASSNIIVGVTNICPTDQKLGINGDVGAAKDYLYSIAKNLRNSCAPVSNRANIDRLNNGFAICAAAFFKAYKAQYGEVTVVSAFRDGALGSAIDGSGRSANQCAGGAPSSKHTKGLAIDASSAAGYQTMWKFAQANPQFGVCFPYQDGSKSGYNDPPHMSLAGSGGREGSLCAAQGVTKPCTAGASFVPTTPTPGSGSPTTPQSPTAPTTKGGVTGCPSGYVLYNNQCFPAPDEAYPANPTGACPVGTTLTAIQNNDTGISYNGCVPSSPTSGQSYCQFGYVFVNNQCAPTQCNGSSQYAVTNLDPIEVISCNQQQNTQCPQGYILINNRCAPFSQNQNGMSAPNPSNTGGAPSSGSGAPAQGAGNGSTGGSGSSGTQQSPTTGNPAPQCTPQYTCQDGVTYYQTSFCATQVYQTCRYGCAGNTCAISSTSSTSTRAAPNFLDQLNQMLHPAPANDTSATIINTILDTLSGNLTLKQDIANITNPSNGTAVENNMGSIASQNASNIITAPSPLIVTQTFTSNDPNGFTNSNNSYSPTTQIGLLQRALDDIRTTLISMLIFLHVLQQPTY